MKHKFKIAVLLLLAFSAAASAQEEEIRPPLDLEFRSLKLEYRTESLNAEVQNLQTEVQDLKMEETETEIRFELSGDVLFDFNKWNIRPVAKEQLSKVAEVIKEHPDSAVVIVGHTDSKGSDSYNMDLSRKRADSVRGWLINSGVNGVNLKTIGLGETKPVALNQNSDGSDNPQGRQQNRRVEISIRKS